MTLRKFSSLMLAGLLPLASCATTKPDAPSALAATFQAPNSQAQASLVLLGTAGGPGGRVDRAGIASLLSVKGKHYLVDAGEGVSRQLAGAGISPQNVSVVFLTHLHDDHTAGLPGLMTFAYTLRTRRFEVIGPPRTKDLVDSTLSALKPNAEIRLVENNLPAPPEAVFVGHDVEPGLVYSDENVRVRAVENSHYQARGRIPQHPVASRNRSYSYRFETADQVIVFSGDTGPSAAVAELAKGADILVAEMVTEADVLSLPPVVRPTIKLGHLTPSEVGELAASANVKTLVLSHVGMVSPQDLAEVRSKFSGRVVLGEDLNRF